MSTPVDDDRRSSERQSLVDAAEAYTTPMPMLLLCIFFHLLLMEIQKMIMLIYLFVEDSR
jgi:hypothetical protein